MCVTSMSKEGISIVEKVKPGERRRRMRGAMKKLTKEMGEDIEGETNWARTNSLGTDDQTARKLVE